MSVFNLYPKRRPRNNNENSHFEDRFFKNKEWKTKISQEKKKEFSIQEIEFPALDNQETNLIQSDINNVDVSFVNIVKEALDESKSVLEEQPIDPGWVSLKLNAQTRRIEIQYGEKTEEVKKLEYKEKMEQNLTFAMNKAIINMTKQHLRYAELYDDFNGEGAYENLYRYKNMFNHDEWEDEDEDDNENNEEVNYHMDDELYYYY